MKRIFSLILAFVFSSTLIVAVFAAESFDSPNICDAEEHADEDIGIAPDHLLPFVYTEDSTFDFFRDLIGPNDCI